MSRELQREKIVAMLLADRKSALEARNPSAAVSASTRIADLLLKDDAEAAAHQPVAEVAVRIYYQVVCPRCKELGPVTDVPPEIPIEPGLAAKPKSAWDEGEE